MTETTPITSRLGYILWIAMIAGTATVEAAEPVYVWEVVSTFRTYLNDGRLTLTSDGKGDKGLLWEFNRDKVDFGREGRAAPRAGGTYFKGNWVGGWQLCARVVMSDTTLVTEPSKAAVMRESAGESMVGIRPSSELKDSIVDVWEFMAVVPGTKKFIRLTCDFSPDNLILDGNRKIATFEAQKRELSVKFVDPKFGDVEFKERKNNVLSARVKTKDGVYWNLTFVRVQRQAVYRTADNDDFIFYTNNRVNSPRYTPDFWTTYDWYFYIEDGKQKLAIRDGGAQLTAGGRAMTWGGKKMILVAGYPLQ